MNKYTPDVKLISLFIQFKTEFCTVLEKKIGCNTNFVNCVSNLKVVIIKTLCYKMYTNPW